MGLEPMTVPMSLILAFLDANKVKVERQYCRRVCIPIRPECCPMIRMLP